MSKISEALKNTQGEVKRPDPFAEATAAIPSPGSLSAIFMELDLEEEMIRLHQRLDALLPGAAKRVVQFIASQAGEGTSTVAREFARVSATRFGKLVLLLDSSPGSGSVLHDYSPDILSSPAAGSRLYRAPLPGFCASLSSDTAGRSDAFWEALRQRYELVVVDSPPATASADGLAMCGRVDGVVLVLQAERTRWPVAQSVKNAIVRSGGKVLGVVLNRRKFYIPNFIYRRL
jgi:protein-tyrosine kinase